MRKRTVTCISKNIFWYLIYLLPWICALISFIYTFKLDNAGQWISDAGFSVTDFFVDNTFAIIESFGGSDGFVGNVLFNLFGPECVFRLFGYSSGLLGSCIFMYFNYFVGVYLIHLCIDFLLFIPRLAHKWMNSFTKTEDCD